MILRELFYVDRENFDSQEDDLYSPEYDTLTVKRDDTRKTRLTLQQINRSRKFAEIHQKEQAKELDFVRQMYGIAANAEAGV